MIAATCPMTCNCFTQITTYNLELSCIKATDCGTVLDYKYVCDLFEGEAVLLVRAKTRLVASAPLLLLLLLYSIHLCNNLYLTNTVWQNNSWENVKYMLLQSV